MKLNHDCIRDLLLAIEEAPFNKTLFLSDLLSNSNLKLYPKEDVIYTAEKLIEVDYINGKVQYYDNGASCNLAVRAMTWEGHKLLDNIKDKSVWEEAKNKTSKLASVSIPIISEIAAAIIGAQLK